MLAGRESSRLPEPGRDQGKPPEYLATERTFLAWVRTGVTIIALRFVVVKFSLLTRELSGSGKGSSSRFAAPIGVTLVLLGGALVLAALVRLRATDRDLAAGVYRSRPTLTAVLTAGFALVAILLAVYLATSS